MIGPEVGLISDTHGLLRPEATAVLAGVELILHAGDVGPAAILDTLEGLAPVTVVRGNTDRGADAARWPYTAAVEWRGHLLYMVHDIADRDLDVAAGDVAAVVYGHSHRPAAEQHDRTLFVNPGSAGPRRFDLPVTVARLRATSRGLQLRWHDLLTGAVRDWPPPEPQQGRGGVSEPEPGPEPGPARRKPGVRPVDRRSTTPGAPGRRGTGGRRGSRRH